MRLLLRLHVRHAHGGRRPERGVLGAGQRRGQRFVRCAGDGGSELTCPPGRADQVIREEEMKGLKKNSKVPGGTLGVGVQHSYFLEHT